VVKNPESWSNLHHAPTKHEALTTQPLLGASPGDGGRSHAACAAALASVGAGKEAAKLTHADRAVFRTEALDWLRADLDAGRGLLD
jgi:hypothetical protein